MNSTCRICLQKSTVLISVFARLEAKSLVAHIITECTSVQVDENDDLPKNICQQCATELQHVSEFIKKARQSDQILRDQKQCVKSSDIQDVCYIDPDNTFVETHTDLNGFVSDDPNENALKLAKAEEIDCKKRNQSIQEQRVPLDEMNIFEEIILEPEKWICCACWAQFNCQKTLKSHCDENHKKDFADKTSKKFSCQFCYRSFSSAVAASAHTRKIAAITLLYECKVCGLRIVEQLKCIQHSKLHAKKAKCRKKNTPSLQDLYKRFGRLCCALGCSEIFETEDQLLNHSHSVHKSNKIEGILTYNEGKPIECPICFKRFKQDQSLERHLRFKYNETSNVCTLCGARFPTLTSLTIHERSHTKEKPFACEICSRGFGDKQSLKRHYVKHTDDKPFMCSVCGVSFKRKRAMQSHMIIHAPGQLPFKCEVCEKRFRVKAKLLYHMRTHTGEKPYNCRYCAKTFADFSNRMRHEQSHTGP
ncbi:gastrula zinc finger protein XlCGF46.1-like isoform X2 [Armigeres subalbatus]|uniref:gastrula zinc finger protein XlCGF46.1-like isoform X2 n=1 Tax=Armigeres subalbatus TaxID=124917 RepID=UPI002ED26C2F